MNNSEIVQKFLNTYKLDNRSPETIKTYGIILEKFTKCVKTDLSQLSLHDIDTFKLYMNNKKYSYATIAQHLMCVKSFIGFLANYKYITEDFSRLVKLPKRPQTIKENDGMTLGNQKKFIDYLLTLNDTKTAISHKLMLIIYIMTGVRKNELLNVKPQDVDLNNGTILIHGKGNKERYVPIPSMIATELKSYMRKYTLPLKYDFIFSSNGSKLSDSTVNKILERRLDEAGIEDIRVHGLRHSCANALFESGANKDEVQMALGHESVKTTEKIYINYTKEKQMSGFSKNILNR